MAALTPSPLCTCSIRIASVSTEPGPPGADNSWRLSSPLHFECFPRRPPSASPRRPAAGPRSTRCTPPGPSPHLRRIERALGSRPRRPRAASAGSSMSRARPPTGSDGNFRRVRPPRTGSERRRRLLLPGCRRQPVDEWPTAPWACCDGGGVHPPWAPPDSQALGSSPLRLRDHPPLPAPEMRLAPVQPPDDDRQPVLPAPVGGGPADAELPA